VDLVLVHGAYHGAWCWELLARELEARGHRVTAVDLPISDPQAGLEAYAATVARALKGSSAPVLIGHSLGGLVLPLVAARQPVRRLVFVAAFLPQPGLSLNEQRQAEPIDGLVPPTSAEWTALGDDVWQIGPNTATELFFDDASPELAAWATARLRPQAYRAMNEPSPLREWPAVPSSYVVCRHDRALNPEYGRTAARTRLGVEPLEIDGAHSPFLTRPAELAALLAPLLA
jgi:pimeloyl-ACP methyl ester carboxylesterase